MITRCEKLQPESKDVEEGSLALVFLITFKMVSITQVTEAMDSSSLVVVTLGGSVDICSCEDKWTRPDAAMMLELTSTM